MPSQTYIGLKQLLNQIQNQLRSAFPATYWVKAEIAGIRRIGGHVYFDLIELSRGAKVAQIKACAFWGEGTNAIAGFEKITGQKFTEGIKIGVRVAVNYHPVYGLSLVLHEIDVELTLGGIELQRKETLQKLVTDHPMIIQFRDGHFITPNKLLRLPRVIQRIALVTSLNSDAFNDFIHSLTSNEYQYKFYIDEFNVLVQGYGAQSSLFNALSKIRTSGIKYDAVVMTRGGGAPADFLPFDDYHLALEVAQFPYPIVTGLGHHMNQGITDYFAKVHTKTPSIAAQYILEHNLQFEKKILELSRLISQNGRDILFGNVQQFRFLRHDLQASVNGLVRDKFHRLLSLNKSVFSMAKEMLKAKSSKLFNQQLYINNKASLILHRHERSLIEKSLSITFMPKQLIRSEKQAVLALHFQLLKRVPQVLAGKGKDLNGFKENIQNLSPERILKRGFAIVKKNGKIISSSASVQEGDSLQIIHDNKLIDTTVKNKEDYYGTEFNI